MPDPERMEEGHAGKRALEMAGENVWEKADGHPIPIRKIRVVADFTFYGSLADQEYPPILELLDVAFGSIEMRQAGILQGDSFVQRSEIIAAAVARAALSDEGKS